MRLADSLGAAAFGLGDDVLLGNAHALQVLAPHRALVVLVAAVSSQGNDQRSDAATIKTRVHGRAGRDTQAKGRPSYSAAPNTPIASDGAAWSWLA